MNVKDYMSGRNEGMAYGLKIVKEKGIEGLENECKFRGATNLPSQVARKYADEMIEQIKTRTLDTVLVMALSVLRDQFDFGSKRLASFANRFLEKTENLIEDYATWDDLRVVIQDETGINVYVEDNKLIVEVKGERLNAAERKKG